jgi:DNA-binding SARP family transcriptional activator/tetratricopeptide (TPR) repeat protein
MRLGLLGTLEVWSDEAQLAVMPAKLRTVLAALALQPRRVVPAGALVAALWDTEPPAGAWGTVRTYVKRLRQTVGPAAAAQIVTRSPGYLLDAAEDEVDVLVFVRLCGQGGEAVRAGRWEEGADLLRRALALWRGAPLTDVPSEVLRDRVSYLEQTRLQALEERTLAYLSLGQQAELVPELQSLVDAHPLHEGFRGQLMTALYLAGRQGDALAAFRRARATLVAELGTEPGEHLRSLHQRILAGEVIGAVVRARPRVASPPGPSAGESIAKAAAGIPGAVPQPQPRQLPAAPGYLAGRLAELAVLDGLLEQHPETDRPSVRVCAVSGTAGVGKTALALYWGHRVSDRFPDGQLYLNLRGFDPSGAPVTAAEAVRSFLDALGVPTAQIPVTPEAQASLYRTLLADRSVLIVLDNAVNAQQVRPLLPGGGRCVVIVTSRDALTSLVARESALPLPVGLLTSTEAYDLLARRLGAARLAEDASAAADLIRLCSRLPLALAIGAARALQPHKALAVVAAELRDSAARLDNLAAGDELGDVRTVFSWSYRGLPDRAAAAFRLLGVHPGPEISGAAGASLLGVPFAEAQHVLQQLLGAHLVAEPVPGRYSLHDLLRVYAAELAAAEAESPAAVMRMVDHYLASARRAARQLDPSRELPALEFPAARLATEDFASPATALAWFRAEHQVLAAVEAVAADSGLYSRAVMLPWVMTTYLGRTGQWHDWAALQRTALIAAERSGDQPGLAHVRVSLGRVSERLGQLEDSRAHLQRAAEIYRDLDDHAGQGDVHITMARVLERTGRHNDSLSQAEQAVVQFRLAGDLTGQANALNTVGWQRILTGQYEQALADCREALQMCRTVGDMMAEAATWDSIGFAHYHLSQGADALACFAHALELFAEIDDKFGQAAVRDHLGDACLLTGDQQSARLHWEQSLAALQDLQDARADQVRAKLAALRPAQQAGPGRSAPLKADGGRRRAGPERRQPRPAE